MRKILLIAVAVLLLTWSVFMFVVAAFNIGAVVPAAFGAWLFIVGLRTGKLPAEPRGRSRAHRILRSIAVILFAVYIGVQSFCLYLILSDSHMRIVGREPDAVIVLGAGFYGDTLSDVLRARLDSAYAISQEWPNTVFVLSGDRMPGESASEAQTMFRYLAVEKGVSPERLLLEPQARITKENFTYAKDLLDKHFGNTDYTTAFVTSDFHIFRSIIWATRSGLDVSCASARTPLSVWPAYAVRETGALIFEVLFANVL